MTRERERTSGRGDGGMRPHPDRLGGYQEAAPDLRLALTARGGRRSWSAHGSWTAVAYDRATGRRRACRIERQPGLILLALLGRRRCTREFLIEVLWPDPDDQPDYAWEAIRTSVSILRSALRSIGVTLPLSEYGSQIYSLEPPPQPVAAPLPVPAPIRLVVPAGLRAAVARQAWERAGRQHRPAKRAA